MLAQKLLHGSTPAYSDIFGTCKSDSRRSIYSAQLARHGLGLSNFIDEETGDEVCSNEVLLGCIILYSCNHQYIFVEILA